MRLGEPRLVETCFGSQPAHHRVVLLQKNRIRRERNEPSRIDAAQEIDGIVPAEVPEIFVDCPEQCASLAVPAPSEVIGYVGKALNALGSGGRWSLWDQWGFGGGFSLG